MTFIFIDEGRGLASKNQQYNAVDHLGIITWIIRYIFKEDWFTLLTTFSMNTKRLAHYEVNFFTTTYAYSGSTINLLHLNGNFLLKIM